MIILFVNASNSHFQKVMTTNDLSIQNDAKEKAFKVLEAKCNFCHANKKRLIVFDSKNMEHFAKAINDQVFLKQRMPKGRKNSLTDSEKHDLKIWLKNLN